MEQNEQNSAGSAGATAAGEDKPDAAGVDLGELKFVSDVPVQLYVELGRAKLSIADLMKCGAGSVITLDKKIGEPFLITLNGRPVAEGEVVEDGANLGVRIVKVLAGEAEKIV